MFVGTKADLNERRQVPVEIAEKRARGMGSVFGESSQKKSPSDARRLVGRLLRELEQKQQPKEFLTPKADVKATLPSTEEIFPTTSGPSMSGIRWPPTPPSRELPPPPPPGTPPLPQPPTPPVEPEGPCDPLPRTKSKLGERAAQRANNRERYSTESRSPREVPQRLDD